MIPLKDKEGLHQRSGDYIKDIYEFRNIFTNYTVFLDVARTTLLVNTSGHFKMKGGKVLYVPFRWKGYLIESREGTTKW